MARLRLASGVFGPGGYMGPLSGMRVIRPGDVIEVSADAAAHALSEFGPGVWELVQEPSSTPALVSAQEPPPAAPGPSGNQALPDLGPAALASLAEAGISAPWQVRGMSNAQILALPHIGKVALHKLRAWAGEG